MKIRIIYWEHDEHGTIQEMEIDGKYVARAGGGEPEDMIIGRDIMSLVEVSKLMERAYNAAKNGESIEIEISEKTEW